MVFFFNEYFNVFFCNKDYDNGSETLNIIILSKWNKSVASGFTFFLPLFQIYYLHEKLCCQWHLMLEHEDWFGNYPKMKCN